jgi:hypothetical protein
MSYRTRYPTMKIVMLDSVNLAPVDIHATGILEGHGGRCSGSYVLLNMTTTEYFFSRPRWKHPSKTRIFGLQYLVVQNYTA